jgi:hypothetical protein
LQIKHLRAAPRKGAACFSATWFPNGSPGACNFLRRFGVK